MQGRAIGAVEAKEEVMTNTDRQDSLIALGFIAYAAASIITMNQSDPLGLALGLAALAAWVGGSVAGARI